MFHFVSYAAIVAGDNQQHRELLGLSVLSRMKKIYTKANITRGKHMRMR